MSSYLTFTSIFTNFCSLCKFCYRLDGSVKSAFFLHKLHKDVSRYCVWCVETENNVIRETSSYLT